MAGLWAGRGGVILIVLVIQAISGSSSQPQLSISNIGSQLSTLASEQVELQKKVEELQKENNSEKARIVQLEKRVSLLEAVCGSETPPPVPGTILLVGGFTASSPSSSSPSSSSSTLGDSDCPVPPLPLPSAGHDSVTLTDGHNILCGGELGSACYTFRTDTGAWEEHSNMTKERFGLSMVSVPGGVYSFGGGGSESSQISSDFLPAGSDTWSVGPSIPGSVVSYSCAAAVNSSHIVLAGGYYASTQVRLYDTTTGEWSTWPSLPHSVHGHACIRTQGGLLLSGGWDGSAVLTETLLLDLTSGQAETVGPLAVARRGHRMVEYRGAVLAVGGVGSDGRGIGSIEEWVPGTKSWVTRDFSLTEPRAYFSVMNVPLTCA